MRANLFINIQKCSKSDGMGNCGVPASFCRLETIASLLSDDCATSGYSIGSWMTSITYTVQQRTRRNQMIFAVVDVPLNNGP